MEDKRDFVFGAIFGEAIGDALGHPIEFQKTHKVIGLTDDNKITDDTQMFCAIGEALLESPPHVDENAFMEAVGRHFHTWRMNPIGGSHRAPGGNCMDAVRRIGAGVHWTKAGGLNSKGNGSAMRSGIVGAYYWRNPEYAFRIGALTSVCTHNNLEALLGAGMIAYLVAACINHSNFAQAVADGLNLCADFERVLPFYPGQVKLGEKFDEQNPWYALSRWGAAFALGISAIPMPDALQKLIDRENIVVDGAVVPAVALAIYFNTHSAFIGHDAFLAAVNNSDDTDTIGAITGTIWGACCGYSKIEPNWTSRIELREYLESLSLKIFEASQTYSTDMIQSAKIASTPEDEVVNEEFDTLFEDGEIESREIDLKEIPDNAKFCKHNRPVNDCWRCSDKWYRMIAP